MVLKCVITKDRNPQHRDIVYYMYFAYSNFNFAFLNVQGLGLVPHLPTLVKFVFFFLTNI